jgi:formate/nitrite transporter
MQEPQRILVVDDDPAVRESCTRILAERGYEVETAASGKEGLERTRRGYFDCALLDLKMPDMDGMEIVRTACANRTNMAVLIVTGYGSVETAAEATRLGVADYVSKPFTPQEISQAVDRALERASSTALSRGIDRLVREMKQAAPNPELQEDRNPGAVAQMVTKSLGVKKTTASIPSVLVLGALAGVYIGFGAALATLVGHDAATKVGVGIAQVLVGSVFSVGLMLVVIAGAELFTGNNLMIAGALGKQYGLGRMLGRWGLVYAANFAGALLLAFIMYESGLWKMASGAVGAKAIAIASSKVNLSFGEAFFRGIGCNWLVCLAVWMALSARQIAGKILAVFFPIMAFVALGYEHCVANMYFVPMGLLLKNSSVAAGMDLSSLTWRRFLTANLVPVTLGNVIGGAIFVGFAYWWVYARPDRKAAEAVAQ